MSVKIIVLIYLGFTSFLGILFVSTTFMNASGQEIAAGVLADAFKTTLGAFLGSISTALSLAFVKERKQA